MPEELFDIFDCDNKYLNITKPRNEVHKNLTDWHRVTRIWILNNRQEVLCQRRSENKDANPGKWQSFFGGHLSAGQSYKENAIKELNEELGLSVNPSDLASVYIRKSKKAKHFAKVYAILLDKQNSKFKFKDYTDPHCQDNFSTI